MYPHRKISQKKVVKNTWKNSVPQNTDTMNEDNICYFKLPLMSIQTYLAQKKINSTPKGLQNIKSRTLLNDGKHLIIFMC